MNNDSNASTINIPFDNYLKLLSSQIVLDVLNKSISKVALEINHDSNINESLENQTATANGLSWTIDYKADIKKKCEKTVNGRNTNFRQRKYFNHKRWDCISRPQYKYSCGISSLVSCWNYLYSTIGHGKLPVLTQESALKILGFNEPFSEIRFGPFTGNATLMSWFNKLNEYFGTYGKASFFYKLVGKSKTIGINEDDAKKALKDGLMSKDCAYIYHCYNHYCCPVGYEIESQTPDNIYNITECDDVIDWFLLADTSKKYPTFHSVRWSDINQDLNMINPEYINIRHLERGVMKLESKKVLGGNLHCIMLFKRNASHNELPK